MQDMTEEPGVDPSRGEDPTVMIHRVKGHGVNIVFESERMRR